MKRQMAFAFIFHLLIQPAIFVATPAALAAAEPAAPTTDTDALLLLKDSFKIKGNEGVLSSWSASSSSPPCSWYGVICVSGVVSGIRLAGVGISGTINVDALAHFKSLRSLSLMNNDFSGPFPADLARLKQLRNLFLSHNRFSGEIPNEVFISLDHLKKLWLNHNQFSGPIPSAIFNVARLVELRLENNAFEGPIPSFTGSDLKFFNASNNHLAGPIPATMVRFGASSFAGNPALCGPPLDGTSCSSLPPSPIAVVPPPPSPADDGGSGNDVGALVGAVVAVIAVIALLLCLCGRGRRRRRRAAKPDADVVSRREASAEAMESATPAAPVSPPPVVAEETQKESTNPKPNRTTVPARGVANLVIINEQKGTFGLADMMKATAEVLGNGGLGSAYKASMANGVTVAVKRMREMNRVGKEAFDEEMKRIGTLRHPNVLTPLAYHYRKEEKLIVSDYMPRGSLRNVLHGDRGPDHRALDWPTRAKIARGIARGMAYLQAELAVLDVAHGNLKSSNVLLADDFEPLIADYGFIGLVSPTQASQVMFAYRTPEGTLHHVASRRSDVYCLGVVILELVTGKFPSQYMNDTKGGTDVVQWAGSAIAENREAELLDKEMAEPAVTEEMVRLLRVGAACVEANPEERPEAAEVAQVIDDIANAVAGQARQVGEDRWLSARTDAAY